ncbi:PREDICTED: protein NipSnap [Nicrophorus vespilloides]|uniref:Protein NipSnap n=1 Tax=Nicrophorus vespilloides TaxID=110193 RepID=A0ABM1M7Z0_NICVS|nr:PREDICTED: protein NipSnap [Nicrophorus vespilloides]
MASKLGISLGFRSVPKLIRPISTSPAHNDAWLSKLLVRKIEPTKESHSRMLSDKDIVYGLQTHNFRPDSRHKYIKNMKNTVALVTSHKKLENDVELVGSWTVNVGDQDQAIHLWQYRGGFQTIDDMSAVLNDNQDYMKLYKEQSELVRSRHLQYLLAFSYWPQIESRSTKNIYEIRSYALKPGTMIEWGNNWARAINHRQNNHEAFAGFFSQIGRLYNVHHIWCYKDLTSRKETRQSAWRSPGWDECVAYTVPLIREMHCRILEPTEFSPTQ